MENIIDKLNRDVRNAAATLSHQEARYLVDLYYQISHIADGIAGIHDKADQSEPR